MQHTTVLLGARPHGLISQLSHESVDLRGVVVVHHCIIAPHVVSSLLLFVYWSHTQQPGAKKRLTQLKCGTPELSTFNAHEHHTHQKKSVVVLSCLLSVWVNHVEKKTATTARTLFCASRLLGDDQNLESGKCNFSSWHSQWIVVSDVGQTANGPLGFVKFALFL